MTDSTEKRPSGPSRRRKARILAGICASYYLLAAITLFLTIQHIQDTGLSIPPAATIKSASELKIHLRVGAPESYGRRDG